MGTAKKDLAYYMALPYSIKEEKLSEEEWRWVSFVNT